jgi:hypothetical protein
MISALNALKSGIVIEAKKGEVRGREPLLFKVKDFSQTNIRPVIGKQLFAGMTNLKK